jgi:hypothetical protein
MSSVGISAPLSSPPAHYVQEQSLRCEYLTYINMSCPLRYPYYACEIFTCEIDGIFTTVFESAELLDLLFSLLERPSPLPPVLAGYFAKVVSSLLTRRTADCMLYLQARALASHHFLPPPHAVAVAMRVHACTVLSCAA